MINLAQRKKLSLIPLFATIACLLSPVSQSQSSESSYTNSLQDQTCSPLLDHQFRPLMGSQAHSLCEQYQGKVLLVVNTASRCGFTPQFDSLQRLYKKYQEQGFSVVGFPSDDFRQELSSEEAVAEFCQINYGVDFPMYQKVNVSPTNPHPMFEKLAQETGFPVTWNFHKYLIDQSGQVRRHFPSHVDPLAREITQSIESLLRSS